MTRMDFAYLISKPGHKIRNRDTSPDVVIGNNVLSEIEGRDHGRSSSFLIKFGFCRFIVKPNEFLKSSSEGQGRA